MLGRLAKPFNPLLGETYELVTPDFRFINETVSHHPPINCCKCDGPGFELFIVSETSQRFTGKQVQVTEKRPVQYKLFLKDGSSEVIEGYPPMLVVGNLFIGDRYCEPQGPSKVENRTTGDVCFMDFKTRGAWTTPEEDKNFLSGTV